MDTDGLIAQFRREADDTKVPYLWQDEDVQAWLDEAEQEAAIRAHLLPEKVDTAICQVAITAETASYVLHTALLTIRNARLVSAGGQTLRLQVVSQDAMDGICPNWRDEPSGQPKYLIHDEQTATLVPAPSDAGTLKMDVYRLPLSSFDSKNAPEIAGAHHHRLVDWVLFRAYSKPDAETIDKTKAAEAEARFRAYFGPRPDAQLGRDMASDQPHHNVTYI